jgi:hypothetical protein
MKERRIARAYARNGRDAAIAWDRIKTLDDQAQWAADFGEALLDMAKAFPSADGSGQRYPMRQPRMR